MFTDDLELLLCRCVESDADDHFRRLTGRKAGVVECVMTAAFKMVQQCSPLLVLLHQLAHNLGGIRRAWLAHVFGLCQHCGCCQECCQKKAQRPDSAYAELGND